jgi:hypothetical protein
MQLEVSASIPATIEEIGMCEIGADDIQWSLDNDFNVMKVVMLSGSEKYCAFLSPIRLAESIIMILKEMNDGEPPAVDVTAIITKAFVNTNFAVMKLDTIGVQTDVTIRPSTPIVKVTKTIH